MNRKEMETILKAIWTLMELLTPYINKPDLEEWYRAIGIVTAVVFATDEEAQNRKEQEMSFSDRANRITKIMQELGNMGRDLATHEGADYCYLSSPEQRGETGGIVSSAYRINVYDAIERFGIDHVWDTVFV